jgi:sulfate adenylyltransferase
VNEVKLAKNLLSIKKLLDLSLEEKAVSKLVSPLGGNGLKALLAPRRERAEELVRARGLQKVPMTSREVSDVLMMAMGAYTPIDGFMGEADWRGVCLDMKLGNGIFWPIPITLSCDKDLADSIHDEEEVALTDGENGEILAIMKVSVITMARSMPTTSLTPCGMARLKRGP